MMDNSDFTITSIKPLIVSLLGLIISYVNINQILSIIVLILSIIYTGYKIEEMHNKRKTRLKEEKKIKSKLEENDNNNNN